MKELVKHWRVATSPHELKSDGTPVNAHEHVSAR